MSIYLSPNIIEDFPGNRALEAAEFESGLFHVALNEIIQEWLLDGTIQADTPESEYLEEATAQANARVAETLKKLRALP